MMTGLNIWLVYDEDSHFLFEFVWFHLKRKQHQKVFKHVLVAQHRHGKTQLSISIQYRHLPYVQWCMLYEIPYDLLANTAFCSQLQVLGTPHCQINLLF